MRCNADTSTHSIRNILGASMSGDLEEPSKSIPKGTLWAVGSTFCVYTCIVVLMGGSISRATMYSDLSVLQDVRLRTLSILQRRQLYLCSNLYSWHPCSLLGRHIASVHCLRSSSRLSIRNIGRCHWSGQNFASDWTRQLAAFIVSLWSGYSQDR